MQQQNVILRSHMDHISSMLQERLSAHELIQSYGQEKTESTHFSSQAKQVMDASIRGSTYSITFNQLSAFLNKIGNTLIYCAGCYYFVKGSMGYGDVVAFCAYATQILGPVVRFTTVANQVVQVGVSVDRINEVLDREPAITEAPDAVPVETLKGDIKVDGVTFKYDDGTPALEDVHLSFKAGMHLALVGPAGSGRSTMAMLVRRFYEPGDGNIQVDGTDIKQYQLKDYPNAIAMALPESAIFDDTIRANLCYGKPDAAEERMIEVSKAVGLHSFVEGLADGYDTRLGTGGLKLSPTQLVQLAVARAVVMEPAILTVDDTYSTIEEDVEKRLRAAVRTALQDRTIIIATSRLSICEDADLVVTMQNGKVIQVGTHEGLLSEVGLYRRMYMRQMGMEDL